MKINNYKFLLIPLILIGCHKGPESPVDNNVTSSSISSQNVDSTLYFPSQLPDEKDLINDKMGDFQNHWYSKHLASMNEPILYLKRNASIFRYTNLGTFSNPFMIRIELKNGKYSLVYKKTNGQGGYDAGVIVKEIHKDLSVDEWVEIHLKINSCKFWEMASYKDMVPLDGTEWILEGVESNRYHFVTRNTPDIYGDEQYASLCNYLAQLAE